MPRLSSVLCTGYRVVYGEEAAALVAKELYEGHIDAERRNKRVYNLLVMIENGWGVTVGPWGVSSTVVSPCGEMAYNYRQHHYQYRHTRDCAGCDGKRGTGPAASDAIRGVLPIQKRERGEV